MTKLTQAILIFLIPPIFRLLAMKRIRMYMPFVCGSRWQWYFSFCSLEPKWTRRTLSFCPLGSLSPSSALHLDTLVWVEVLSQISLFWTILQQYYLEDEFLEHCKCWVFLAVKKPSDFPAFSMAYKWLQSIVISNEQVRWENKKLGIAYAASLILAPAYIIFKVYQVKDHLYMYVL